MHADLQAMAVTGFLLLGPWLSEPGRPAEPQAGTGNQRPPITARLDYPRLKAGNHLAEFLPNKAYLPLRGHMLTVEFLGTPGVMPRSQAASPAAEQAGLERVSYEDLWPGTTLSFVLNAAGNCEATYLVSAGADVSRIRLRYNVPALLQADGTLHFQFSTGSVTESSPEAWQQIRGRRVAVPVSFTTAHGEVGFRIGSHDPGLPVIIDPIFFAEIPIRKEDEHVRRKGIRQQRAILDSQEPDR